MRLYVSTLTYNIYRWDYMFLLWRITYICIAQNAKLFAHYVMVPNSNEITRPSGESQDAQFPVGWHRSKQFAIRYRVPAPKLSFLQQVCLNDARDTFSPDVFSARFVGGWWVVEGGGSRYMIPGNFTVIHAPGQQFMTLLGQHIT